MPLTEAEYTLLGRAIRQELDTPRNRYVGSTVIARHLLESIQVVLPVAPAPVATRRGPLSRDEERAVEGVLRAQFEAGVEGRPQDMTTIPGLVGRIQEALSRVPPLFSSRVGLQPGELFHVAGMASGRQSGMSMGAAAQAMSLLLRAGESPSPILNPSVGPGGSPAGTRAATAQEAEDTGRSRVPMLASLWSRDLVVSRPLSPAPPAPAASFTPANVRLTEEQRQRVTQDARRLMASESVNPELDRVVMDSLHLMEPHVPVNPEVAMQRYLEEAGPRLGLGELLSVGTPRRGPSPEWTQLMNVLGQGSVALGGSPEVGLVEGAIASVLGTLVGGTRSPGSTQLGMLDREYEHMSRMIREGLGVTEERLNREGTTAASPPTLVALDLETQVPGGDPVMMDPLRSLWEEAGRLAGMPPAYLDAVGIQSLIQQPAEASSSDRFTAARRELEALWNAPPLGDGSAFFPMVSGGGGSAPLHVGLSPNVPPGDLVSGSGPVVRPIAVGEVVFQTSGGLETLRLSSDGEVYFRGRKIDSDPELVKAFRLFLCAAGALKDPKTVGEDLDSRGILSRFDREGPV